MRALIYDTAIVGLTAGWYAEVLNRLEPGAHLLDVGVGTGGALARNADDVRSREIRVTGVDIDADYVAKATARLADLPTVDVRLQSVYDHQDGPYDAVYFAASFMLMPDPIAALDHVCTLLKPGGRVFFTQTFQDRASRLAERVKPLLKKVTTIDFGSVTYEPDFRALLDKGGMDITEMVTIGTSGSRSYRLITAVPQSQTSAASSSTT